MKHQALFSSKIKVKKCRLRQFLFGALRVKYKCLCVCLVVKLTITYGSLKAFFRL